MFQRISFLGFALAIVLNLPCSLLASETEMEMSLTDLVYVGEVSVASKKGEKLSEAPGIISIITAEDIARMPMESLYDVLRSIPGVTQMESFYGLTNFSFRGIKETHYNNRTTLLLNGHALRNVTVGNYWVESIPVQVIDRIEIIRGPGSVMYGTGAFAGVINVITKKGVDVAQFGFLGGSKTTTNGSVLVGRKIDPVAVLAAYSYNKNDGYWAYVKDEAGLVAPLGVYGKNPTGYKDNYYNAFASVAWESLSVDVYHFDQKKNKFGLIPNHLSTGEDNAIASGVAAHYAAKVGPVEMKTMAYYDQYANHIYLNLFPPAPTGSALSDNNQGYKYGLDLDGQADILAGLAASAGVSYEYQQSGTREWTNLTTDAVSVYSTYLTAYDTYDLSGYAQLEYKPFDPLKVVAGVRFNHNREYGDAIVPRASLVYQLGGDMTLKALYGSAYRNPTFFEKYVNTPNVLYGEPDLKPEKIDTFELGFGSILMKQLANLTLFYLSTDQMIGRFRNYNAGDVPAVTLVETRATSTLPTRLTPGYTNAKGQNIAGVELEVKGSPLGELLSYNLNVAYKDGLDKQTEGRIEFLEKWVANLSLTNRIAMFTTTLVAGFVGERQGSLDPTAVAPGLTPGAEVLVPAYTKLDLKTSYRANANVELSVVVTNLLQQKIQYPEYIRRRIETIPGDSGSYVFGEVKVTF